MKKYFVGTIAAFLLSLPLMVHAQTSISGTVVDRQTQRPVAGASVAIPGTQINTATGGNGEFTLTSDHPVNRIIVTCIGYNPENVQVSNSGKPLFIQLTPSQTRLPGIEVVGSSLLLRARSVGVLTQHDLTRFSGLKLGNAINTIPGVFMQSRTPWGGARVTIRGYYPNAGKNVNFNGLGYQVFLNNIPITDASGLTVMDGIDFTSLGKVEVIKGPESSRYGNSIGGTLLLYTARPTPNQTSLEQQVISGSYGLFRSNTTFQSAGEHSNIVVNYGHQSFDSFRPHSASKKDYIRINGDFEVADRQTISTYFAYGYSYEELAGEIDGGDFYNRRPVSNARYLANNSHTKIKNFVVGVTDDYRISRHFGNRTTVFGTGHTANQPFAHGFTDANQFNFGARSAFDLTTHLDNVGINGTLGGMFQRSDVASNGVFIVPAPPFPQIPNDQENYAMNYYFFTEWGFSLPDQFTVTVGASLNKNNFGIKNMLRNNQVSNDTRLMVKSFKPVFAPHVSVSKVFNEKMSVYASISSGYTPPLLGDATASDGSVNLALRPERAVQYEVGARGNLLRKRLTYQLSLFDLENTHKLVSETSNSVTFTTNAGKQRNRGAELSISWLAVNNNDWILSLLRPWVSYSYSDFKYVDFKSDNNNDANTVDYSGNSVARVAPNVLNAGVDLKTRPGFYLNGTWRFVDKAPVTFDNSTWMKPYNLLSLKVGYMRRLGDHFKLDLFAGGDNLLGNTYYSFLFVGPEINGLTQSQDGGSGDGYIIPGPYKPTVYGSFTLSYIF